MDDQNAELPNATIKQSKVMSDPRWVWGTARDS